MKPNYDGLVESWKMDLVESRARRKGIQAGCVDDLQQELIFDVMNFRYEAEKSNGASEKTVFTGIVDRCLANHIRSESRYKSHVERFKTTANQVCDPSVHEQIAIDVRAAMESLTQDEKALCIAIMEGYSPNEIAQMRGCGWHAIERSMRRIRRQFEKYGLGL
jgi:DNA-directed RNA polymerase specialized sigma24 family protein